METENYEAAPGWWNRRAIIKLLLPLPVEGESLNLLSMKHVEVFWNRLPNIQTHFSSTAMEQSFSSTYRINLKVWRLLLVLLVVSQHHSFAPFWVFWKGKLAFMGGYKHIKTDKWALLQSNFKPSIRCCVLQMCGNIWKWCRINKDGSNHKCYSFTSFCCAVQQVFSAMKLTAGGGKAPPGVWPLSER